MMTVSQQTELPLYLFADASSAHGVKLGSAIVGTPQSDGMTALDFEGNVYGAVNLTNYEERLQSAAGRHAASYPTSARIYVKSSDLVTIGFARYSPALRAWFVAELSQPEMLRAWLNPEQLPRVGGSRSVWDRAAGLAITRQPALMRKARGDALLQAAYTHLQDVDPALISPPAHS